MKMKDLSWKAFKETGDIDAYLLYKTVETNEKQRGSQWNAVKQEGLSQDGRTTGNQTVC